ncbi:MAG TPA: DUF3857 domain-containing transglutaminase family protein [Pyrinomonadaceae bacterium]|nr:DUF3857 domain-containing transglutaminase family protein [Pyrinomonadaceae bacterium]
MHYQSTFHLILLVVLTFTSATVSFAKGSFSVKPAPSWVRAVAPSVGSLSSQQADTSSSQLLSDEQTKVGSNGSVERYYHYVTRVDGASGLDDLSQLRFYFEPSYQQLVIHFVRIQRGSSAIDILRPAEIKIVQQEEELDQQLFNGTLAAVLFVNDLRIGDSVDFAYSINGENPVLGGRFTDTLYLADTKPIQEHVIRLVVPTERSLDIKNNNTKLTFTSQSIGQDTEYLWYDKNIAAVSKDDYTPVWFDPYPTISVSEFRNWSDVVQWALPFYQQSALHNRELVAKVAQWKQTSVSTEDRLITALRFVQDEIRYLGIELGRYSHQPTSPDQVFARRFGDCKDKSLLLSSILTAMDIDAVPVLINTRARSTLDSWQPSPFAFDHVIVRATLNGKTYWFDPTISYQRGTLRTYYDPPFERALVLRPGEQALSRIPPPNPESRYISIIETYTGGNGLPVTLKVDTTYQGADADEVRYGLATESLADLSKEYLNYYADSMPSIKANGLPVVKDDPVKNTLVVTENYLVDDFWKDKNHTFLADKIYVELDKRGLSQRTTPLKVKFPLRVDQTIFVNLGSGYDFPSGEEVFSDDAMHFEARALKNGNHFALHCSLKTFADSVAVDKIQNHLRLLGEARQMSGFDLAQASATQRFSARTTVPLLLFLGFVLLGGGYVVIRLVRENSNGRAKNFAEKQKVNPGATAETALPITSNDQIEALSRQFACRCGATAYNPAQPPTQERFSYDGEKLVGVRFVCGACGQTSDLYLRFQGEQTAEGVPSLST